MMQPSVSIHAPWEGCDDSKSNAITASKVSIHAPWEGCDCIALRNAIAILLFQFTHPGKGATITLHILLHTHMFQFTHPGKGATPLTPQLLVGDKVSIHAPWEGCDATASDDYYFAWFQFTHPGKGATVATLALIVVELVSIHAPWEGCDSVVQSCVL